MIKTQIVSFGFPFVGLFGVRWFCCCLYCGYGGVCIYVSNSLKSKRNLTYQSDGIELVWIEIQIEKLNILIGSCYRLPNQPADEKNIFLTKLQDSIKSAGKPVTQESSLDVFCHVIFDVNIDVMDVRGRTQEFVAL